MKGLRRSVADGVAHVGVDVAVGAESKRQPFTEIGLELVLQRLLVEGLQPAARVVDDHDGPGPEESLAQQERAHGVVARNAAGVAHQVRLTQFEPERAEEVESRVHAREHA